MDKNAADLLQLFQIMHGLSKKEALVRLKALSPEGQRLTLATMRKLKLEQDGHQMRLDVGAATYASPPERAKKVPYTLLLPPMLLDAVKDAVELDGSSVSQFIRTAIADKLKCGRS
jgi:hypothetical protein